MTPDELRGLVFAAMAAEDEAAGYQATFQGLTDVVMPVLAEALAERDAVFAELRAELVTARAQINEWRGHFTSIAEILRPYGDEVDSPVELAGKAAAEIQQLRAELDRWVDSARAASDWLVRFSAGYPMGTRYAEIIERIEQDRADLARLRERAAVLPDNWRTQINATRPTQITTRIESWRPSTGDTDGTPRPPLDATTKAEVVAAIEAGRYIACGDGPEYWPDCTSCEATGRITECPDCDGVGRVRPAALPEGTPAETTYRSSGTVQRGLHGEECDGSSGCQALGHIEGCFAALPEGHAEQDGDPE